MTDQVAFSMIDALEDARNELKRLYQRHLKRAFIIAAVAHFVSFGAFLTVQKILQKPHRMVTARIIKYSELGPPPSLTNQQAAPQIAVSEPVARPTVGIPEPVPDAEVSEERTIATQTEMSRITAPVLTEGEGSSNIQVVEEPKADSIVVQQEEALPQQGEFVPYEEAPQEVSFPKPTYPEIARQAEIEGEVFLQILIDKTGRVRDVLVLKSSFKAFDEVAKKAAWKSVWKPAIQNTTPVAVWVTKRVIFKLH
ncbi:MAG: TonB family protein [Candidatus Latescibacteria bacterium]|nr:TonB family protein [Candidatus Latescibacterota bacterium]